jgi:hypothetical protein
MACGTNENWTLRFPMTRGPDGAMELLPESLTLRLKTHDLDYCRASFSPEVGEMIKPHTRVADSGQLRFQQPVEVRYDGTVIARMRFAPDMVTYDDSFTKIELDDLQKSMDSDTIDTQYPKARLRDIYTDIFEEAEAWNNFFDGIRFTVPEDMTTEVWGSLGVTEDWDRRNGLFETGFRIKELEGIGGMINKAVRPLTVQNLRANENEKLLDANYAFDFEDDSPFSALMKLNDKFGATTWAGRDGYLWVGSRATHGRMHYTARDDSRVWTLESEQIRHARDPILGVIVEGKWIDAHGIETDVDQWVDWFDPTNDKGGGDVRAQGICLRDDIDRGRIVKYKDTEAARSALPSLAREYFINLMKDQYSGTVDIAPTSSGFNFGHPAKVKPGDFIHVLPQDKHFDDPSANAGRIGYEKPSVRDCEDYVNNEIYLIQGATHTVEGGHWNLNLDVAMYPEEPITAGLRYFDPEEGEPVSLREFDRGLLEGV